MRGWWMPRIILTSLWRFSKWAWGGADLFLAPRAFTIRQPDSQAKEQSYPGRVHGYMARIGKIREAIS